MEFIDRFAERMDSLLNPLVIIQLLIFGVALFFLYRFLHRRRAFPILLGALAVYIVHILSYPHLTVIHGFTEMFVKNGAVVLVLLFHPELRAALEYLGSHIIPRKIVSQTKKKANMVVEAVTSMAEFNTGALIFFEGNTNAEDVVKGGVYLDAEISSELLINIFSDHAPLHDGAVMIRDGKIHSASCFIKSEQQIKLPGAFGSRHQAALTLSASCDSIVIAVSEEDGSVSIAERGELLHDVTPEVLRETVYRAMRLNRHDAAAEDTAESVSQTALPAAEATEMTGTAELTAAPEKTEETEEAGAQECVAEKQ